MKTLSRLSARSALLPLVLLSVALVTPAYSNWFHGLKTPFNRSVGSAPSPTPHDITKNRAALDYPLESVIESEEGTVGLKIFLFEDGTMRDAVVEKSSGFWRLDDAAIDYVKEKWKYAGKKGDDVMPTEVRVNVTFDLR